MQGDRAYLSVVEWPTGWGEGRCVEALVGAAGLDPDTCALAIRRGVPAVVSLIDELIAGDVVGMLRDEGVLAFAPTRAQIRAWPEPVRVKALHLFPGGSALGVEPWRGEPTVVRSSDIRLIVGGANKSSTTEVRDKPDALRGAMHWHDVAQRYASEDLVERVTTTTVALLLDITAASEHGEPVRLRIDADKMSFGVLGEDKGITDRDNMAKLTVLVRRIAPGATIDDGFDRFGIPTDIRNRTGSNARTAAFDFYCAWVGLLYRELGAL